MISCTRILNAKLHLQKLYQIDSSFEGNGVMLATRASQNQFHYIVCCFVRGSLAAGGIEYSFSSKQERDEAFEKERKSSRITS